MNKNILGNLLVGGLVESRSIPSHFQSCFSLYLISTAIFFIALSIFFAERSIKGGIDNGNPSVMVNSGSLDFELTLTSRS